MALKSNYVELEDYTSTSSYGAVSYIIPIICVFAALLMYTRGWSKLSRVELIGNEFGTKITAGVMHTGIYYIHSALLVLHSIMSGLYMYPILPVNALHSILRSGCRL